jgi:hypothetical protein
MRNRIVDMSAGAGNRPVAATIPAWSLGDLG